MLWSNIYNQTSDTQEHQILTGLSDGLFEGDLDGDFDGEFVGLFVGDFEGLDVGDVVGGEGGGQVPMQAKSQDRPWLVSTQEPAITVTPDRSIPPVPAARAIAACSISTTSPVKGLNVILTTVAAKRKTVWRPMALHSEKSTSQPVTPGSANTGSQISASISSLSGH